MLKIVLLESMVFGAPNSQVLREGKPTFLMQMLITQEGKVLVTVRKSTFVIQLLMTGPTAAIELEG